jgi:hypothetical protein
MLRVAPEPGDGEDSVVIDCGLLVAGSDVGDEGRPGAGVWSYSAGHLSVAATPVHTRSPFQRQSRSLHR